VNVKLIRGDCIEVMATLPAASIDACVTDPPYEIGFMNKRWDSTRIAFQPQTWREVLRVLKPGAHLLAFGGTRTFHRIAVAIEDAGFEIRDCLAWLYGSGFPKSLNLGEGLGTALKPAYEPIVLARKPFKGTVAQNVQTHGTGALNIDACRIGEDSTVRPITRVSERSVYGRYSHDPQHCTHCDGTGREPAAPLARCHACQREPLQGGSDSGRWPANVCLDELAALVLDEQSGELVSNSGEPFTRNTDKHCGVYGAFKGTEQEQGYYGDSGGASRFFYVAKPSREERDYGIWHDHTKSGGEATNRTDGSAGLNSPRAGAGRTGGSRNFHPTVKPVELMRWLVRLVTPIDGTVLDPFLGSGTTGMACRYELRNFIGIEREREYIDIAERRIGNVAPLFATPADPEAGTDTQGEK
jgi:DNA modification methylase